MSIIISDLSYHYYNQLPLFEHLSLSVPSGCKASIVGSNGTGKSTLLRLISGELLPQKGSINCSDTPFYLPQRIEFTATTVAQALGIEAKIAALHSICHGSTNAADYDTLHDDWDIEARCAAALNKWELQHLSPTSPTHSLSGGEKTRLLLAAITLHDPRVVLLDEPTNHLDAASRQMLYHYIAHTRATLLVVSHDITLLNLLSTTHELTTKGWRSYGGNYQFYSQQKAVEEEAIEQHISAELTSLRHAQQKAQEVKERQERRVSKGKKEKQQIPRIMRRGLKDKGEKTTAKLAEKHRDKQERNEQRIEELRKIELQRKELKLTINDAQLHEGKILVTAHDLNVGFAPNALLWQSPLNFTIRSGDRIHLTGNNGAGKTTLIHLITGELAPSAGKIVRSDFAYIYLDQDYNIANSPLTLLQLAEKHNHTQLADHEVKMHLHRALFTHDMWNKPCHSLSGGERMRLCLCCIMISNRTPDLIILDEPGNNLDIAGLRLLATAINSYKGTLIVITHDTDFAEKIALTSILHLKRTDDEK